MVDHINLIQRSIGLANEPLRELLGCDGTAAVDDATADQMAPQQIKFFSALTSSDTVNDYANRLARFLRLMIGLARTSAFSEAVDGINLLEAQLRVRLVAFAAKVLRDRDDDDDSENEANNGDLLNDLQMLFQQMVHIDSGLGGNYANYPACVFVVSELSSHSGLLVNVATAEKSISAIKFALRGTLLIEAQLELKNKAARGSSVRDYTDLECLKHSVQQGRGLRSGSTNTLSVLSRIGKAINTFTLATTPKVIFSNPTDPTSCTVNNKRFGTATLSKIVSKLQLSIESGVHGLLLGLKHQATIGTDATTDHTPGWAFGRHRAADAKVLRFCSRSTKKLTNQFWTSDKPHHRYRVDSDNAAVYLRKCIKLEKDISVLFHVLSGAGTRATDIEYQTFRNGTASAGTAVELRNVTIIKSGLDQRVLQFAVPVKKTGLLHGKAQGAIRFVPLAQVHRAILYYRVVRPFAHFLRKSIRTTDKLTAKAITRLGKSERWDRFLFVKPSSSTLRRAVETRFTKFSRAFKFNELRHFSVAVHRHFVTPQELQLQEAFPVHQQFGHAKSTDLSYGTGTFASNAGDCDASAVLRCSQLWWKLLEPTVNAKHKKTQQRTAKRADDGDHSSGSGSDTESDSNPSETDSDSSDNDDEDDDDDDDRVGQPGRLAASRNKTTPSDAVSGLHDDPDFPEWDHLQIDDGPEEHTDTVPDRATGALLVSADTLMMRFKLHQDNQLTIVVQCTATTTKRVRRRHVIRLGAVAQGQLQKLGAEGACGSNTAR